MTTQLHISGANETPIWGMPNTQRLQRLARQAGIDEGLAPEHKRNDTAEARRILWVDQAYAFDPLWFRHMLANDGLLLTDSNRPVLGHVDAATAQQLDRGEIPAALTIIDMQTRPVIYNDALRKQQQPFCMPLTPQNAISIERESYEGAYKGITDLLTLYLWKGLAFHLTRGAAKFGLTPNMVTAVGAVLCVLAFYLFWIGEYWLGIASGFAFMVLDTVDGKLARCTITSSWWGNIFDHGIDLIHPPFWYWAWAVGLSAWGMAYDTSSWWWVLGIIWGGYIVQRLIEGEFIRQFGIHIHVWRKFDSDFRLITARRNPNMIPLIIGLIFGRPDLGLAAVAAWTLISLIVHLVQLAQAYAAHAKGAKITSWLEQTT